MNEIYFITGNRNKFREIKEIIPTLKQLDIDLPEIQEVDPKKVIEAKLTEATKHTDKKNIIVEDTSLYLDALNGLPGPLIKWYIQKLGVDGMYNMVEKLGNFNAQVITYIGFLDDKNQIHFFNGKLEGTVVPPTGDFGFGFDPIFKPNGYDKTLGEMGLTEKNRISMRKIAAQKLRMYLNSIH